MSIVKFKEKRPASKDGVVKKFEIIGSNAKSSPTIIARDLAIEGDLTSGGLIEVEGGISGTIRGNSVILREESIVNGTIIANTLNIRGSFEGAIKVQNLSISSKAKVLGNIEYHTLCIEDGASIDGQFKKTEKEKS